MKNAILILSALLFSIILKTSNAQKTDEFEKLKKLYVEHKYEACLMKSEKYIYNEKTKREPVPYLYFSKSNFELSQSEDPDILEYYPKALKNALKYAIKFKQKDKDGRYLKMAEDYIPKLTNTYLEKTQEIYDDAKYSKASANYKQLLKLVDDDNIRFAKGICDALNNNPFEARTEISLVFNNYKNDKANVLVANSEILLINYGIDYSDYLLRQEKVDTALSTINILMDILPKNISLIAQKDKIEASIPDKTDDVEKE